MQHQMMLAAGWLIVVVFGLLILWLPQGSSLDVFWHSTYFVVASRHTFALLWILLVVGLILITFRQLRSRRRSQ